MNFVDNFFMVIALLTDFGTKDYFVAAMKGVILSINPEVGIIDITHAIPLQDVASAAFVLKACYGDFPHKTVFVCVVDPGVGSSRRALVVETENYIFVAPDNGLLDLVLAEATDFKAFTITNNEYLRAGVSNTFHGRDIFAPAAAHLSRGVGPSEFGCEIKPPFPTQRHHTGAEREARIIYIDHFGNLVTNIGNDELTNTSKLEINGVQIAKLYDFYAEAEPGELFMIRGSAGLVEISARDGSAQAELRIEVGERVGTSLELLIGQ